MRTFPLEATPSAWLEGARSNPRRLAAVVAGAAVFWWIGGAIEKGGPVEGFLLSLAVMTIVGVVASVVVRVWGLRAVLSVEAPLLLLLMSTFVLRQRSADDIAYDPLDPAAQFRVACVAVALLLAGIAVISSRHPSRRGELGLIARPLRFYIAYVWVVFIGAIFSIRPTLTAYRGLELVAGVLVIAGALHRVGRDAVPRMLATLFWFLVALILSAWLSAVLAPNASVVPVDGPIPWQLQGTYPKISANGVGTLGAILLLWVLGRRWSEDGATRRRLDTPLAILGAVTLIAAQYRTGYVATVVGLTLLMVLRRRALLWLAAVFILLLLVTGAMANLVESAEPVALRGQSRERATELSGRFKWWHEALPVWKTSPVIGRGLLTGTRFEVLDRVGYSNTSSIHGTWIEALVGTGVIGTAALGAALLTALGRAGRQALHGGSTVPIVLLTFVVLRSLTGPTIEVFGFEALLFLALALATDPRGARARHDAVPAETVRAATRRPAGVPA